MNLSRLTHQERRDYLDEQFAIAEEDRKLNEELQAMEDDDLGGFDFPKYYDDIEDRLTDRADMGIFDDDYCPRFDSYDEEYDMMYPNYGHLSEV